MRKVDKFHKYRIDLGIYSTFSKFLITNELVEKFMINISRKEVVISSLC